MSLRFLHCVNIITDIVWDWDLLSITKAEYAIFVNLHCLVNCKNFVEFSIFCWSMTRRIRVAAVCRMPLSAVSFILVGACVLVCRSSWNFNTQFFGDTYGQLHPIGQKPFYSPPTKMSAYVFAYIPTRSSVIILVNSFLASSGYFSWYFISYNNFSYMV